jgi:Family of unknown function (DUF6402)
MTSRKHTPFIDSIPKIMGKRGWRNGQRLMETWFARPRAVLPDYSPAVTDVVTMDWVLGFERAKRVYDKLVADRIWINKPAQKQIAEMLGRKGLLPKVDRFPGTRTFGNLAQPVPVLDAEYVNYRAVSYGDWPQLDDLTAALGDFTFRVAVSGTVAPSVQGGHEYVGHDVTINEVGIYVRDSYDFEGEQFLGYWDTGYLRPWGAVQNDRAPKPTTDVSLTYFEGGLEVGNADFRKW